jgi:acetyl-CoA C-acetyltransferase
MSLKKVAVVGAGMTKFGRRLKDTGPELCYQAGKMALDSSGLKLEDIDFMVSPILGEYMDGVGNKVALWNSSTGAWRKPIIRPYVGGGTGGFAIYLGYCGIASGLFDTCLISVGDKSSSADPRPQHAFSTNFDPILEQPFSLTAPAIFALRAARYLEKYGLSKRDVALVAVKNKKNGLDHPCAMPGIAADLTIEDVLNSPMISWPINRLECVSPGDGGAAVVLASENIARRITDKPVWIEGVGFVMDTFYYMNKSPDYYRELEYAAEKAYKMAGIKEPRKEINVIELWDSFTFWELQFLEAMKICPPGEACRLTADGVTNRNGDLPVSPSGGQLGCGQPAGAVGPWRVAEIFWQLRGEAGKWQVPGKPRRGIAQTYGGVGQSTAVVILGI